MGVPRYVELVVVLQGGVVVDNTLRGVHVGAYCTSQEDEEMKGDAHSGVWRGKV